MPLPTPKMVAALTLVSKVSGATDTKEHFSMYWFLIPTLLPIGTSNQRQSIGDKRGRSNEHMSKGRMLSLDRSPGSMSRVTSVAYKRLASMLSGKRDQPYSLVMAWLRCRLGFSLLRSAITCLRGARSFRGHAVRIEALDLAVSE